MQKYSLTTPQKNIWNLQKYYEGTSISNICGAVLFNRKYEIDVINQALNKVIELQEGLRLRFCYEADRVVQYVHEYEFETFEYVSFSDECEMDNYADQIVKTPMNMVDSEMYRITIFTFCYCKAS